MTEERENERIKNGLPLRFTENSIPLQLIVNWTILDSGPALVPVPFPLLYCTYVLLLTYSTQYYVGDLQQMILV